MTSASIMLAKSMTMISNSLFLLALAVAIFPKGSFGVSWAPSSLAKGATVYACDGGNLTLKWEPSLAQGETITDIKWFFSGRSEELVGLVTHGHLSVMAAYSGAVERSGAAGVTIRGVQSAESGNYSIEITVIDTHSKSITLRSFVNVVIGDGLAVDSTGLHASLAPEVLTDEQNGELHVAVACGKFSYKNPPPFFMEWTTPSGQVLNSSRYIDGQFLLFLPNPVVTGGKFSCRVPSTARPRACLHSDDTAASVTVDPVMARLMLVDAKVSRVWNTMSCSNVTVTTLDESWRLPSNRIQDLYKMHDDRHLSGWYRFKAKGRNARIVNHNIHDHGQCGTYFPFYIELKDDQVPALWQEVEVKAVSMTYPSGSVRVKNCGTFLAYKIDGFSLSGYDAGSCAFCIDYYLS